MPHDDTARRRILLGVSAAAFLGPFTQTVYTPSLPELRDVFHVDTLLVNLTISPTPRSSRSAISSSARSPTAAGGA